MSLPPSQQHPSPDPRSQAGASAISWWQKNADNVSTFSLSSSRPRTTQPQPPTDYPPTRITIPVSINPHHCNPDLPPGVSSSAVNNTTKPPAAAAPAPPPSGGSTPLIDLLSNDDVSGGANVAPPMPVPPMYAPQYNLHTPYSTHAVFPPTSPWTQNTHHPHIQVVLTQHTEAISRLSTMIDILHNNHDDMNYHLSNLMKSIQDIQSTLNDLKSQPAPAPSLIASSASNSNSLSSDLSYTQEMLHDASSKAISIATNNHHSGGDPASSLDKKIIVPKYTYDPNDRVAASRWYKDVLSILSASSYYNALLDTSGNINLATGSTIINHNLYNILYRSIDTKFQKVAHSSHWTLGTDILSFVHNTFSDNSSFLDDAREAHSSLSQIRWNANKETIMDFAEIVSDLYAKLKNTEYERIITPVELRRLWILALPLPIFTTIRGKITTNDDLPQHWTNATTISSLIEATRKEIASQKAHATLANMLKKGTQQTQDTSKTNSGDPTKTGTKPSHQEKTTHQDKSGNQDNYQRHPFQDQFTSMFDTMRAIEHDIFQGLSLDTIHSKYAISQDANTCVLCRFKSNHKRYHHTRDCQEIKKTYDNYNGANSNNNSNITVYLVSKPCSRMIASSPINSIQLCHDTGTPLHLFNDAAYFSTITYFPATSQPSVALGDEKTLLPIIGYGIADFILQNHRIRIKAYLVPSLGINLFSPTQHIKYESCSYTLSHNMMIAHFPDFRISLNASENFTSNIAPAHDSNQHVAFDATHASLSSSTQFEVKLQKLHPSAFMPFRATSGSVGYDLTSFQPISIPSHGIVKIPLGFALEIPNAYRCQIASRSSLAAKGIVVLGGVIDNDYRGDITVILSNTTNEPFSLPANSKIAQLLFIPTALPAIVETNLPLTATDRNTNGFGSTNTSSCRRVHRPHLTLPTIPEQSDDHTIEVMEQSAIPTKSTKTTSDAPHTNTTVVSNSSPTIRVHNPPARLRQTTLDLFLKLNNAQTPSTSPSLHPTDRVPSSTPALVSMTSEMLQKCTGFRNIHKIMKLIKEHAAPTIDIQDLGRDPFLSRGEVATLPKSRRNTSPIPRPDVFGSIIHYDIGYGAGMSIGGYTHVLFLVDRATRKKFIYGLKSLHSSSICAVMQDFIKDLGCYPSKMLADRDFKIIGDHVKALFRPNTFEHGEDLNFTGTHIAGAPQGRQNQNGLSEGNWKYVCNMARNFLTENLLPRQFWFHALKYAVHVSNYLPVKLTNGQVSTPHELAHGTSPDYRKLIPIFSVGHTKVNSSTATGNNALVNSQTVPTILIGLDDQSDGCLFYNPTTKQIISSSDYRLDHSRPSGPIFNLPYETGTFGFSLYNSDNQNQNSIPPFNLGDQVFVQREANEPSVQATILAIPLSDTLPYTVQLTNGQVQEEYLSALSLHDPSNSSPTMPSLSQYPWVTHGAKVTIFLTNKMTTPKQGFLYKSNTNQWSFIPGRSALHNNKNKPIPLPDFEQVAPSLIQQHLLAHNWLTVKNFLEQYNLSLAKTTLARRIVLTGSSDPDHLADHNIHQQLQNNPAHSIATIFKISAAELDNPNEPKLHEHYKLSPKDKHIWDESYREEYFGLHEDTQTWQYITEEEYQNLKTVLGRPLPTMAISKIKRDSQGNPIRAKYRIVVLGNLDPHQWSKADCFAPVLSALELRLLIAIATHHRIIPKQCDAIQAFCQTTLPPNEQYVCTPPKGCPFTPPNTYLLLKKTLYGLKRSPRHWYETAKSALQQLNLQPCPNAPCIFTGKILPHQAPIYVGIYVDDFIYFSPDPEVEKAFETMLPSKTNLQVEFNGPVHHFLGIKFAHDISDEGHVTIHMSQEADIHQLLQDNNLHTPTTLTKPTPYRSGHPVDTIPNINMPISARMEIESKLRAIIGSCNWLSTQTRPDIATITNIIAQYQSNPSPGHLEAAKYVLRYLKGTSDLGITFSSNINSSLQSFVKFPIAPDKLYPFSDANWGPQDASAPKPNDPPTELELFKSRSISGFVIWLGGPLHWVSKRQSITARSSTEAEIYAIDECTKCLQHISNILTDLNLLHIFTDNQPISIHNDNEAAVKWSHNMTTKGLRHIQMRENAVREQIQLGFVTVEHIGGKHNLADAFTKEEKDTNHFITCRDLLVTKPLHSTSNNTKIDISQRPKNTPSVYKVNNIDNFLRDARDATATSSLMCLPQQARGVLSPVRRTLGHMLQSTTRHLSSHSF